MRAYPIASVVAAARAVAGCSSKRNSVADLPPLALSTAASETTSAPRPSGDTVSLTRVPGSQADLIALAGSDRVFVAYGSFALANEARAVLARQAAWLRANQAAVFTVQEHADERGTRAYNLALGDQRANAVDNFLAAQDIGVERRRTISDGKQRPEALGSDAQSYAKDRRAGSMVASGAAS